MTSLPLIVRRTIINQWAEELIRFPESRRAVSAMRFNDRFCALGVFADLCTRKVACFEWRAHLENEEGPDGEERVVSTHAIGRIEETGLDIRGLPQELCWILGFSGEEEARISKWSDGDLPFAEIAVRLRTIYVGEDPLMEDLDHAWGIVRRFLPDRNRNPNYLEQFGDVSAWEGEASVGLLLAEEELSEMGESCPGKKMVGDVMVKGDT